MAAVERYKKECESMESNYMDVILFTEGAFSYQDVMTMPVDSLRLLIQRMNHKAEERNKAIKRGR